MKRKKRLGRVAFVSCCLVTIETSPCELDEGRWSRPRARVQQSPVVNRLGQLELGQGLQLAQNDFCLCARAS